MSAGFFYFSFRVTIGRSTAFSELSCTPAIKLLREDCRSFGIRKSASLGISRVPLGPHGLKWLTALIALWPGGYCIIVKCRTAAIETGRLRHFGRHAPGLALWRASRDRATAAFPVKDFLEMIRT
jgi:hypothetical protein